jgi:hypothetical protein
MAAPLQRGSLLCVQRCRRGRWHQRQRREVAVCLVGCRGTFRLLRGSGPTRCFLGVRLRVEGVRPVRQGVLRSFSARMPAYFTVGDVAKAHTSPHVLTTPARQGPLDFGPSAVLDNHHSARPVWPSRSGIVITPDRPITCGQSRRRSLDPIPYGKPLGSDGRESQASLHGQRLGARLIGSFSVERTALGRRTSLRLVWRSRAQVAARVRASRTVTAHAVEFPALRVGLPRAATGRRRSS